MFRGCFSPEEEDRTGGQLSSSPVSRSYSDEVIPKSSSPFRRRRKTPKGVRRTDWGR